MESLFEVNTLTDFVGNKLIFETIYDYFKNIKDKDKLLLIGPSGIGKTKYIELLCKEFDYECLKIDSSCCENSKDFLDRLEKLHQWKDITQMFIETPKKRILVLDELESLIKVDRNIPSILLKFWSRIDNHLPCILIGQYEADKKISELRKACQVLYLQSIQDSDMFLYLKRKLPKNKIKLSDLMKIAEESDGSIYAAIESINTYLKTKKTIIKYGKDKSLDMNHIFQYTNYDNIYQVLNEDTWINPLKVLENAPKCYSKRTYTQFMKLYMTYEEWISKESINDNIPIGFLSYFILYNNVQHPTKKKIDIQFTKILSYISTQKKLQRSLYEKLPNNLPINEIGFYWVHQFLQATKFSVNTIIENG